MAQNAPPLSFNVRLQMNNYRDIVTSLTLRLVPSSILFGLGWVLLVTGTSGWDAVPQLLLGMACFLVAAIIIARPIARLIAEPAGNLFYPEDHFDRPQPMYGIPESKRKKGLYEEAMAGFEKIANEFPNEIKPYVEMIDIAIVDLKDAERAHAIYRRGISVLKNAEAKEILARMYNAIRTRLNGRRTTSVKPRRLIQ
jgi:hypothetical protein